MVQQGCKPPQLFHKMHQPKIKILAIPGSVNDGSTSHQVLKYIAATFNHQIDLEIYAGLGTLPHFNPVTDSKGAPAEVMQLRTRIAAADGVLFCTPEYVFSLPGSLKNAIEWMVSTTLFSGKPVAMIVAAASGQKAFESLDLIMTTIESVLPDTSKLLIQAAKGRVGQEGEISDEDLRKKSAVWYNPCCTP